MSSAAKPDLAVIASFVLFRTGVDEVARAVGQVLASPLKAHVVLVDNSPEPNMLPPLDPDRVTLIRPGSNLGYGAGHNRAFAATAGRAPFHAAMNTDLVYGPEVLPALVDYMRDNAEVGLALPRVCYPDGRVQYVCRLLPRPMDMFGRGFLPRARWTGRRNDRYEFRSWSYDRPAEFPFLSGCFMMLRRAVVDEVGGFDERFFLYGEDADLSRRIARRHRTMFFPAVTVQHEYRSEGVGLRRHVVKIVNLARYFNKWGWWKDREREAMNAKALAAVAAGAPPASATGASGRPVG